MHLAILYINSHTLVIYLSIVIIQPASHHASVQMLDVCVHVCMFICVYEYVMIDHRCQLHYNHPVSLTSYITVSLSLSHIASDR